MLIPSLNQKFQIQFDEVTSLKRDSDIQMFGAIGASSKLMGDWEWDFQLALYIYIVSGYF